MRLFTMVMGLLVAFFRRTMGYRHGQNNSFSQKKLASPNKLCGNT
jgi:hypothetical protein